MRIWYYCIICSFESQRNIHVKTFRRLAESSRKCVRLDAMTRKCTKGWVFVEQYHQCSAVHRVKVLSKGIKCLDPQGIQEEVSYLEGKALHTYSMRVHYSHLRKNSVLRVAWSQRVEMERLFRMLGWPHIVILQGEQQFEFLGFELFVTNVRSGLLKMRSWNNGNITNHNNSRNTRQQRSRGKKVLHSLCEYEHCR